MHAPDREFGTAGASLVAGAEKSCHERQARTQSPGWPGGLLAAMLLLIVGLVGAPRGAEPTPAASNVAACITLEVVGAHGHLDDVGYRRVVRSLTSASNPYREAFPASYREFMDACRVLRAAHDPKLLATSIRAVASHSDFIIER